ncbi:MAG: hypothetical protein BHV69_09765 [Bacteroidales bacterium 52_46]|nr:MAG: hypothetical protein BHV69_09765 [Bacteroidales bacterium 52_46]
MAKQPLIEAKDVSKLITLFDRMYKLGVEDGYQHSHDEGLCREHIETTNYPGNFGLIRDGFISDEIDWQLTLQREAKAMKIYEAVRKMFIRMGAWARSNFYSCILPVAQDFYNMGVEDFLANPNADTITTFMEERRVLWGGKRVDTYGYVEKIQGFCGKRMRSEAAALEGLVETRTSKYQRIGEDDLRKRVLKEKWWLHFRRAVAVVNTNRN